MPEPPVPEAARRAGDVLIVIPAAGASRRMGGRDKLLETIDGRPLLVRQTARALATGAPVVVTLPPDHAGRRAALAALKDLGLSVTEIDAGEGMAASLREGARRAAVMAARGMMILPADMPDLDSDDLLTMLRAFQNDPGQIHRGSAANGRPGHPVIFPPRLLSELQSLSGDTGGRGILSREDVRPVPLPGNHALTDLDTPEDWAAWRAARGTPGAFTP